VERTSWGGVHRSYRDGEAGFVGQRSVVGTTTRKGLKVPAEIDDRSYPAGIKVPDEKRDLINIRLAGSFMANGTTRSCHERETFIS
jgi:hypothetical protein